MMKRRIATLLAFVMLITTFQGVSFAKAKALYGFEVVTDKVLSEEANGLQEQQISLKQESAMASWSLDSMGKYSMQYYILDEYGQTRCIELIFDKQASKTDFSVKTHTSTGGAFVEDTGTQYVERKLNLANSTWMNGTTTPSSIQVEFMDNAGREAREVNFRALSVTVGDGTDNPTDPYDKYMNIRVKVEGTNVKVYTTGINNGQKVPFKLFKENTTTGAMEEVASSIVFNGPSNFKVTPVHLVNSLDSLDEIEYTPQSVQDGNLPGSKPGVKVTFAEIMQYDEASHVYKSLTNPTEKVGIVLGAHTTNGNKDLQLEFLPKEGASVLINSATTQGNVVKKDAEGNLCLYIAQDTTDLPSEVIEWELLEQSNLITAYYQEEGSTAYYSPESMGYTYLGTTIEKTGMSKITLTIDPFKTDSKATYSIYAGIFGATEKVYAREFDPTTATSEQLTATVDVGSGKKYIKIVVTMDGMTFESQTIIYNTDDFTAVPNSTTITNVDHVFVIPDEEDGKKAQTVGFDMTFTVPEHLRDVLLENPDTTLYYELFFDEKEVLVNNTYQPPTAGSQNSDGPHLTKVFKVYLDANDDVAIEVLGTAGKATYDPKENTVTVQDIVLKNLLCDYWEQITKDSTADTTWPDYYLGNIGAEDSLRYMEIPENYYFALRPVIVQNGTPVLGNLSVCESVSLDFTKLVVPVPTEISGSDISNEDYTELGERITYGLVDIQEYVDIMLEPAQRYLRENPDDLDADDTYKGTYEIYFYQDSDKLDETAQKVQKGAITPKEIAQDGSVNFTADEIKELRKGEVFVYEIGHEALKGSGTGSIAFKGLDDNTTYYVSMRVRLNPWTNLQGQIAKVRYSELSKEFTFTTSTAPQAPDATDKVPPAPEKIWIEEMLSSTSVKLGYSPAEFEEDEDIEKTYYEFIRTETQLSTNEKSKTVEDLVKGNDTRVGFRTDSPTANAPYISTYTSKKTTWTKLSPEQAADTWQLVDDTLKTNRIYYYYVRTVCVIDGEVVKSTWIMVPVTTDPISAPINLKVENPEDYNHDTKDEIVISFDAAVPEDADIPSEYEFNIVIKGDEDEDYTDDVAAKLISSSKKHEGTPEGYTHFVYKLSDLESNTRYYIKVQAIDKTQEEEGVYPSSIFVGPVFTRTDYDEDEQKDNEKYDEYLKQFDSEIKKLQNRPYWDVELGVGYKYRTDYLSAELGLNSEYNLVAESKNEAYYYIPATLFTTANEKNTTFNITLGNYTASIRPDTLTDQTREIKDAISKIDEDSIEDYYVKVSFALNDITGTINGQTVITPKMTIDMEVVYLNNKMDEEIESEIYKALTNLIVDAREEFAEELEEEIKDGDSTDSNLSALVDDHIEDLMLAHAKKVKRIIDNASKKTVTINAISKPILIIAKVDAYEADAYYLATNWISTQTFSALGGLAVEADKLGTYVLTGRASLVNTVPSLAPYQSFIAKYNLTDFFTLDPYMIKTATTKEQLYGAVARMLGATRGTNYTDYLTSKNIQGVSKITLGQTIRQDEMIYIIMQAYEQKAHRPVSSIMIQNRQGVQNIGAFQPVYRNYVYAAVELQIIQPVNGRVIPSKQMTVEEVIAILYRLDNK